MHLSFLFLITFTITPSFADDVSLSGCDRTFSCGPIQNITYPFTGGDRPAYCGPPEFRLTCPDNSSYPELIANSLTYRVLQIDQGRQILKLVRLDLYNNTCPEKFINSTLNSTIFTYGPDTVDLTLIYGCPSSLLIQNMFTCNVNGVSNDAYYFIGPVPVPVPNFILCAVSLMVPILRIVGDGLTSNSKALGEVLNAGFNVNFSDPYTRQCLDCRLSGRLCGFDSNSSRPICICGHSLCTGAGI